MLSFPFLHACSTFTILCSVCQKLISPFLMHVWILELCVSLRGGITIPASKPIFNYKLSELQPPLQKTFAHASSFFWIAISLKILIFFIPQPCPNLKITRGAKKHNIFVSTHIFEFQNCFVFTESNIPILKRMFTNQNCSSRLKKHPVCTCTLTFWYCRVRLPHVIIFCCYTHVWISRAHVALWELTCSLRYSIPHARFRESTG